MTSSVRWAVMLTSERWGATASVPPITSARLPRWGCRDSAEAASRPRAVLPVRERALRAQERESSTAPCGFHQVVHLYPTLERRIVADDMVVALLLGLVELALLPALQAHA